MTASARHWSEHPRVVDDTGRCPDCGGWVIPRGARVSGAHAVHPERHRPDCPHRQRVCFAHAMDTRWGLCGRDEFDGARTTRRPELVTCGRCISYRHYAESCEAAHVLTAEQIVAEHRTLLHAIRSARGPIHIVQSSVGICLADPAWKAGMVGWCGKGFDPEEGACWATAADVCGLCLRIARQWRARGCLSPWAAEAAARWRLSGVPR